MPGSLTTPGRSGTRIARPPVLPSAMTTASAPGTRFPFAARWLAYALPYRRFAASRTTTHGSGLMWIATPSSQRSCTVYSLPGRAIAPTGPQPAHYVNVTAILGKAGNRICAQSQRRCRARTAEGSVVSALKCARDPPPLRYLLGVPADARFATRNEVR